MKHCIYYSDNCKICMTNTTTAKAGQTDMTLREKLERMKVHCPTCPLPHNLSSRSIDSILQAVKKVTDQIIGDETKGYDDYEWGSFAEGWNACKEDQRKRYDELLK